MNLTPFFIILITSNFTTPEIKSSKNTNNSTKTQNIMKMSNNIISIMKSDIQTRISKYNTSNTTKSKQYNKKNRQYKWCIPMWFTTKYSTNPTKYFNTSRQCYNHCCSCKISSSINILTNTKHMMRPYLKSQYTNRQHCINHTLITKYRFQYKTWYNMRNNTKTRQNQNINFRMTKKPKQMLIQNRITTTSGIKKRCIKITISKQHSLCTSLNRQRQKQKPSCYKYRPYKLWYRCKRHTRSSHINSSSNLIYRTHKRTNTSNMQTQNRKINSWSHMKRRIRQWRINSPTSTSTTTKQTSCLQYKRWWQLPKTYIIKTRKRHINSTNHYRLLPISKTTNLNWHNHKKYHYLSMTSYYYIILIMSTHLIYISTTRLFLSYLKRQCTSYLSCQTSKYYIHCTNIFGICTLKPSIDGRRPSPTKITVDHQILLINPPMLKLNVRGGPMGHPPTIAPPWGPPDIELGGCPCGGIGRLS